MSEHAQESYLERLPRWALLAVAGVLPLVITNLTALGIGPLPLTYDAYELPRAVLSRVLVTVALACVSWLLVFRGGRLRATPALWVLLAFVAWVALATPFSVDPATSIVGPHERWEGLLTQATYAGLFFLGLQAVRNGRHLRDLMLAAVAAAVVASAYGLLQAAGHDPSQHVMGFGFDLRHAFATFINPNFLAGHLVLVWPLAVGLAITERKKWVSIAFWASSAVIWAALLLTYTRGAILAGVLQAGMLLFVLAPVARLRAHDRTALTVAAVALAGVLAVTSLGAQEGGLVQRLVPSIHLDASAKERLLVWGSALKMAGSRPVFGYGPDTFQTAFAMARTREYAREFGVATTMNNAHDLPLHLAATVGIPGAALFMLAAFLALAGAAKGARKSRAEERVLGLAVVVGAAGYLVHLLFGVSVPTTTSVFWLLLGASAAPAARERVVHASRVAVVPALVASIAVVAAVVFGGAWTLADHELVVSRGRARGMLDGDAIEAGRRAVALAPLCVKYGRSLGITLEERFNALFVSRADPKALGETADAAAQAYERVLARHPRDFESYMRETAVLREAGQGLGQRRYLDKAVEVGRRGLSSNAWPAELRVEIARADVALGRHDDARRELTLAISETPQYRVSYDVLSESLRLQGRGEEAARVLREKAVAAPGADEGPDNGGVMP